MVSNGGCGCQGQVRRKDATARGPAVWLADASPSTATWLPDPDSPNRALLFFDNQQPSAYTQHMLFLVVFGALGMGTILIMLIARYSPDAAVARIEEQRRREIADGRAIYPPIPFDEWRMMVIDLLEALEFHIAMEHSSNTALDIIAKSTEPLKGGRFVVHALHSIPGDVVDQTAIINFLDTIRGEAASKGILMTPYTIDTSGLGNLDVPIEFVDGQKIRELLEKYLPKKLDAIDGYRGFGVPRLALAPYRDAPREPDGDLANDSKPETD